MGCNYYTKESDIISGHTDDENYYQRNFNNEPLFVSLILYEDGRSGNKNLARFQIKENEKWKSIELPHLSLLVMSGKIEHRVIKFIGDKFRKRYNITFRTPVKREEDVIKNYRFFSNFGRYYRRTYILYVPEKCFLDPVSPRMSFVYDRKRNVSIGNSGKIYKNIEDDSYFEKVLKSHSLFNPELKLVVNPNLNRQELLEKIKMIQPASNPPNTTTKVSLMILLTML